VTAVALSKSFVWLRLVGCAPGRLCRAALLVLLGAFLAAAYLPGSVVPDTLDMCGQALTGAYTTWHSPVIAGLWGFFDPPIEAIFLLTLAVTIISVHLILSRWLRPWIALTGTAIVVLFPATVGWLGHVGKDQWFAAVFLLGTALVARAGTETRVRLRRALLVGVIICFWLAIAARKNAMLPVGAALLVAWPVPITILGRLDKLPLLRRVLASSAVFVLLLGSVSVFTSVVVRPTPAHPEQTTYMFDLTGISLMQGQMMFPSGTFPSGTTLSELDRFYDVKTGDPYFFAPDTPVNPFMPAPQVSALKQKWLEVVRAHPGDYLRIRLSYSWALLGISAPHPLWSMNDAGSLPSSLNSPCRVPDRTFPSLHKRVFNFLLGLEKHNIFRSWMFLAALVLASLAAGLRHVTEARVLLVAGLMSLAGIALAGISPTFRYSWFTALCALLAVALALRRIPGFARPDPPIGLSVQQIVDPVSQQRSPGTRVVEMPKTATWGAKSGSKD